MAVLHRLIESGKADTDYYERCQTALYRLPSDNSRLRAVIQKYSAPEHNRPGEEEAVGDQNSESDDSDTDEDEDSNNDNNEENIETESSSDGEEEDDDDDDDNGNDEDDGTTENNGAAPVSS
jgi:hypothetical protein